MDRDLSSTVVRHSCTGTIEAAGSEVREVGMNLARGRELGISSRVDEGHDWIHKPSRSFYEGKASVGEATGGSSGDIAVVLGATNGEDEDNDSRDERAETHVAASSSPAPDVASVVSSSAARLLARVGLASLLLLARDASGDAVLERRVRESQDVFEERTLRSFDAGPDVVRERGVVLRDPTRHVVGHGPRVVSEREI